MQLSIWGVLPTKEEGAVAQNRTSYLITRNAIVR